VRTSEGWRKGETIAKTLANIFLINKFFNLSVSKIPDGMVSMAIPAGEIGAKGANLSTGDNMPSR
jgi:hypothetical protein